MNPPGKSHIPLNGSSFLFKTNSRLSRRITAVAVPFVFLKAHNSQFVISKNINLVLNLLSRIFCILCFSGCVYLFRASLDFVPNIPKFLQGRNWDFLTKRLKKLSQQKLNLPDYQPSSVWQKRLFCTSCFRF